MVLQFAFHIIILMMIWPIYPLASAQYEHPIIAHPDCESICGSIEIPYPFGMKDPKCYADKWFEIECRTNTTSQGGQTQTVPYLKFINLEVTSIDVMLSKVEIMNPVFRWNCRGKNGGQVVDLKGSPFVYSLEDNKFMAIGCKSIALLHSTNGSEVSGCVSICDDNEQVNNYDDLPSDGCHGKRCCETSLPKYLSEYNATVQDLRNNHVSGMCSYALIVKEYWLPYYDGYGRMPHYDDYGRMPHYDDYGRMPHYNDYGRMPHYDDYGRMPHYNDYGRLPRHYSHGRLKDLNYVPAMLEWEILNEMLNSSTLELPSDANCYDTNVTSSQNGHSGRRCDCTDGFSGNPYIAGGCIDTTPSFVDHTGRAKLDRATITKLATGISSSFGSIILLLGLWWLFKVVRKNIIKKRKEKFFKQNGGLLLEKRLSSGEVNVDKTKLFSLKDLEKATDHFNMNRVLGKGGQGTVYKGMLADGKIVAVKKFKVQGNVEEFINEFVILSQINHRNVVKLLGCCLETQIPLLVYEFIPNGNLYEYLHDQNEDLPMTWDMRLRIATEIAGALFYLHSAASQPIYHRDIKSTNILLDEKYRAKVADFGTSRMVSIEATHLTTVVQGTFGYLDPEYFHTSQFTEKSDVYSFGVVLVELLTGQRPISSLRPQEAKSLASYFVLSLEEDRLFDIIDERVMKEGEKEHIIAVANLANSCLELNGKKRPTMKEVTMELEGIRKLERNSNAQQNHEEIELAGIEDYQPWAAYSASNTGPTLNNRTTAVEIMPFFTN